MHSLIEKEMEDFIVDMILKLFSLLRHRFIYLQKLSYFCRINTIWYYVNCNITIVIFIILILFRYRNIVACYISTTRSLSSISKIKKQNLLDDECVAVHDSAENYSFVVQDDIQGFHWNNSQCTIHPCVPCYKDQSGKLCHHSLAL